jgi:hypothetical protein
MADLRKATAVELDVDLDRADNTASNPAIAVPLNSRCSLNVAFKRVTDAVAHRLRPSHRQTITHSLDI